jgi:hypothetical protein
MINQQLLALQIVALEEHASDLNEIADAIREHGMNGDGYDGPASYAESAAARAKCAARMLRRLQTTPGGQP